MASVRIVGLTKYFGEHAAVDDLHLEVPDRHFVTFLGPSGCGKTTALNTIAGLEAPSAGDIYLDDVRINKVPPASRDVAMVFQSYALYPHMTVRNNLSFGLKIRKVRKSAIRAKVEEAASLLGISELLDRKPKELSGGQRQRVAIGRAIVRDPKVFLLDEPLSNLDAALRLQMRAELKLLFTRLQATVVYVTHDQAEAMTMSDDIAVMKDGELQQMGSPLDIYYKPVNRFVAGFVGSPSMNFASSIAEVDGSDVRLRTQDFELALPNLSVPGVREWNGRSEFARSRQLVMGIRPEDLALISDGEDQAIRGECMVVERLGSGTILLVKTGKDVYTVQVPGAARVRAGDNLALGVDPRRLYLFDEESGEALVTPEQLADAVADHAGKEASKT